MIQLTQQEYDELLRVKRRYERLCHLLQPILRNLPLEEKEEITYREPVDVFINEELLK